MATETVSAAASKPAHIPQERRMLGLEAAWEIDALVEAIRGLCDGLGSGENDQCELMLMRLQVRGLTARILDLNNVTMSIFDDEPVTDSMMRKVFGQIAKCTSTEADQACDQTIKTAGNATSDEGERAAPNVVQIGRAGHTVVGSASPS